MTRCSCNQAVRAEREAIAAYLDRQFGAYLGNRIRAGKHLETQPAPRWEHANPRWVDTVPNDTPPTMAQIAADIRAGVFPSRSQPQEARTPSALWITDSGTTTIDRWFRLPLGAASVNDYCATEGCLGRLEWRLEAEGVGSSYCGNCHAKIIAQQSWPDSGLDQPSGGEIDA